MKQSCCIHKNSKILREKLKKLGYLDNTCFTSFDNFLYILGDNYYTCKNYQKFKVLRSEEFVQNECVDCGTNEELFLAIAALSDDTDENQWFVIDTYFYEDMPKGYWFKSTDMHGKYHIGTKIEPFYCHKATVEELVEHFNIK